MQFGSDGFTACATCHFNASADSRTMNQTDPGLRRVDSNSNPSADSTIFHPGFGPNHQLSVSDFPLHQLADINRSNSAVLSDNNNIVGSQGVLRNNFNDVVLDVSVFNPGNFWQSWQFWQSFYGPLPASLSHRPHPPRRFVENKDPSAIRPSGDRAVEARFSRFSAVELDPISACFFRFYCL